MELFQRFAFLIIALAGVTIAGRVYHACPNKSVCVDAQYCDEDNIVYNPLNRTTDEKFLCGTLEECMGYVCCSDPKSLARGFLPSVFLWFFPFNAIGVYFSSILPTPDYDDESDVFCPHNTVCIKEEICNNTYNNSTRNYTKCGHAEMEGWVCCADDFTENDLFDSLNFLENVMKGRSDNYNGMNAGNGSGDEQKKKRSTEPIITPARPPHILLKPTDKLLTKTGRSVDQEYDWECGVTLDYARQLTRIYAPVGGHEALEGDFPWHVAITDANNQFLCGGVVVEEKVVLTVAHCVFQQTAKSLLVRLGDIDLQESSEKYASKDATVSSLVIHPDYDDYYLKNDIAILKLEVSLKGLPNIRPACLPDRFTPDIGKCKVPGWGQYVQSHKEVNQLSYQLRSANFHIIPRRECQDEMRKVPQIGSFFRLQNSAICARGYSSGDTCRGDGGSGLVCLLENTYVLKGLVSWGAGCGQNLPGVYTDISLFVDFIRNFESDKYIYNHRRLSIEEERSDGKHNTYYDGSQTEHYLESDDNIAYYESEQQDYEEHPPKGDHHYDDFHSDEPHYKNEHDQTKEELYEQQSTVPEYYETLPQTDDYYTEHNANKYIELESNIDYVVPSKEHSDKIPYKGHYDGDRSREDFQQPHLNEEDYDKHHSEFYEDLPLKDYGAIPPSQNYYFNLNQDEELPFTNYEQHNTNDIGDTGSRNENYENRPQKDHDEIYIKPDYYNEESAYNENENSEEYYEYEYTNFPAIYRHQYKNEKFTEDSPHIRAKTESSDSKPKLSLQNTNQGSKLFPKRTGGPGSAKIPYFMHRNRTVYNSNKYKGSLLAGLNH